MYLCYRSYSDVQSGTEWYRDEVKSVRRVHSTWGDRDIRSRVWMVWLSSRWLVRTDRVAEAGDCNLPEVDGRPPTTLSVRSASCTPACSSSECPRTDRAAARILAGPASHTSGGHWPSRWPLWGDPRWARSRRSIASCPAGRPRWTVRLAAFAGTRSPRPPRWCRNRHRVCPARRSPRRRWTDTVAVHRRSSIAPNRQGTLLVERREVRLVSFVDLVRGIGFREGRKAEWSSSKWGSSEWNSSEWNSNEVQVDGIRMNKDSSERNLLKISTFLSSSSYSLRFRICEPIRILR